MIGRRKKLSKIDGLLGLEGKHESLCYMCCQCACELQAEEVSGCADFVVNLWPVCERKTLGL